MRPTPAAIRAARTLVACRPSSPRPCATALTLRPPHAGDAEAVTAACQDPEIPRWTLAPSPYRHEHAVEWLAGAPASAQAGEAVTLLAFDDDEDGRLAGSFSLIEIDLGRGYGEIGYWVAAEARGRGVATRAVGMLHEWARTALGMRRLEILPHVDNAPSGGRRALRLHGHR